MTLLFAKPKRKARVIHKTLNRVRKTTLSALKRKAWATFSKWIRMRDCNAYQKFGMVAPCFTCGVITHFNKLQAGHFLQGRTNSILFDPDMVHSQCPQCNIFKHGNLDEYWPRMVKIYGFDRCEEMLRQKKMIKVLKRADYEALIKQYEL